MSTRLKFVRIRHASTRGVAERWRSQYQHPKDGWSMVAGGNSKDVYEKLCALGPDPTSEDVAAAIGNKSWGHISCDGCSDYVLRAIEIGEWEPKAYCEVCIQEASAMLKREEA